MRLWPRTESPRGPSPVHRVATVGNVVFAAFLAILFSHDRLFVAAPPPPPPAAAPVGDLAGRVLLVVIDGLRADTAADETLMPTLGHLRREGRGGVVRLDGLIPSTIAGVVALATGTTPPPASVLQDLRAFPAKDGGVLASVRAAGGRCFVAGPPVWADLYGRWIDDMRPMEHLVGSDDRRLVDAAVDALTSDRFRLLVVHLGGPDDAAHAAGTRSTPYADAARAADATLGRLLPRTRPQDLVIVTADHGNTAAGGHAGPEEDVIRVPLVARGPGAAAGPGVIGRQGEIAPFVAAALGTPLAASATTARGDAPSVLPIPVSLFVCGCGTLLCAGAVSGGGRRLQPTLLNLAIWVALAAGILGWRYAAVTAIVVAFAACVVTTPGAPAAGGVRVGILVAVACGALLASLRVADGTGPTWVTPLQRNASLAAGAAACYAAGRWLAARFDRLGVRRAVAAGAGLVVVVVLGGRLAGQTLSLSTIDVRAAYDLAARPATVPLAVLLVAVLQATPVLAVTIGLWPATRTLTATTVAALAAGAGAVLLGQTVILSLLLYSADGVRPSSLALGGLLRVAAEGLNVSLALAGWCVVGGRARRRQTA